jgi:pimeloyl-ACP methyl ester carboxylesterase
MTETVFSMRRLEFEGSHLSYVDAGPREAEPLVLLHGYIGSHRSWRHQIGPLSRGHRVIASDWFGWGDSGRPVGWDYAFEAELERLVRVLDVLGLDEVSLAGHDYGGLLALGLAVHHPSRIRRLMILNSRAQGTFNRTWYSAFGILSRLCRFAPTAALLRALPLGPIHRRTLAPGLRSGLFDEPSVASYVEWMSNDPDGPAWFVKFMGDYRVAVRKELGEGLSAIDCPTAVIWGEPDAYIPAEVAHELARGIPGAHLTLIPRSSHFVMERHPAEVLAAMESWLERVVGSEERFVEFARP